MTTLSIMVFAAIAVLTIGSAFAVFTFRRLFHAVIALTFLFLGCAFVLIYLGESLLALLLLLILIGGISTYLIVAVATEEKSVRPLNMPVFTILALAFIVSMLLFTQKYFMQEYQPASIDMQRLIASALQGQYLLLYFMVLLLFGTTMGGAIVMKRFVKLLIR